MVHLRLPLRVILLTFLVFLNKRDASSSSPSSTGSESERFFPTNSPSPGSESANSPSSGRESERFFPANHGVVLSNHGVGSANHGVSSERFVPANYGVISASVDRDHKEGMDWCIVHYNGDHGLPTRRNSSQWFAVEDFVDRGSHEEDPCDELSMKFSSIHSREEGKVILLSFDTSGRCNISEAVRKLESESEPYLKGLIFVLPKGFPVSKIDVDPHSSLNPGFIVAVMNERSYQGMMKLKGNKTLDILVFAPPSLPVESGRSFDLSLVVIWFIATGTIVVGCWWSGEVRYDLFLKRRSESLTKTESEGKKVVEEEPYLNVTPTNVAIFVVCMAAMLSSLYFFYTYLVYIIICLFVLASILSVFVSCDSIAKTILPERIKSFKVAIFFSPNKQSRLYQLLILIGASTLAISWFFSRKQSWSWILQDILGVFFSLNMLRTIRLPSFRIVTVLLSLLFFYDIFFVFITPFITKSGDSIMVEVATGGSSRGESASVVDEGDSSPGRELLPMVIKIPHLSILKLNASNPLEICFRDMVNNSYSLLGFGDVLVPGLLVSYCHAFDLIHGIKYRPYFITSCISYGVGLIITFIGLFLMEGMAQPALLYLVPSTLFPPLLISWCRGEFTNLWHGPGDGSHILPPSVPQAPDPDSPHFEGGNPQVFKGDSPHLKGGDSPHFKGRDFTVSSESNQRLIRDAGSSSSNHLSELN